MMEIGNQAGHLEVVPTMQENPGCCAFCAQNPMDEDNTPLPAIQVVGVDFDWGNTVYVCSTCCGLIADLMGRVTTEDHEKLQEQYKFTKKRLKAEVKKSGEILRVAKTVAAGDKNRAELKELIAKEEK